MSQGLSYSAAGAALKELVLTQAVQFHSTVHVKCSARPALLRAWFLKRLTRANTTKTYHAVEGGKQTLERLAQHVQKAPRA